MPLPSQTRFRVQVRRLDPPEGPFSLRFDVREGKGAFRLARPGVVIDPPARPNAEEHGLTLAQLRATRFVHVWEGGRARLAHALTRVDPGVLAVIPKGEWVELEAVTDQGSSFLVLPASDVSGDDEAALVDEPTSPMQMLGELREQVDAAVAGARAAGRSVTRRAAARVESSPDEPTELPMGASGWSESPLNLAELDAVSAPKVPAAPAAPASAPAAPAAGDDWSGPVLHERNTTLVRHLRRRVVELELRTQELEARLRAGRGS